MKRLIPVLAAAFVASFTVWQAFARVTRKSDGGLAKRRRHATAYFDGRGQSRIIDLPRDAAEIFVANPRIANAVVRSPRKLYIIGMDAGQTSLYAWISRAVRLRHLSSASVATSANFSRFCMPQCQRRRSPRGPS